MDFETKKITLADGTELMLNIWDFAGEKKFRMLFPSYISGASGAFLLYDITNKASFEDIQEWLDVIYSVTSPPKTIILLESKADLEDERQVTKEDVLEKFSKYKFHDEILSTSAKTGQNVEEAFHLLGNEIIKNSLKKCPNCDKFYPLELLFCQFCGAKTR